MSYESLRLRFWPALEALVGDQIAEGNLNCAYGHRAPCGDRVAALDWESLSRAVRQQIGREGWPVSQPEKLTDEEIVNLAEFFRGIVAYPAPLMCGYCEQYHITFDRPAADDFEAATNMLFDNLVLPLVFADGRIRHKRSVVLSREAKDIVGLTTDVALADLLRRAIDDFFNGGDDRRLAGLQQIVDAFERTKALYNQDKKTSIAHLVRQMAAYDEIVVPIDQLFRRLSEVGNRYSIRHHEPSQQPLTDPALIEFLFFSYFNMVRFALIKAKSPEGAA